MYDANLNYIKERFKVIEGVDISIVEEYDLPMNLEQKKENETQSNAWDSKYGDFLD